MFEQGFGIGLVRFESWQHPRRHLPYSSALCQSFLVDQIGIVKTISFHGHERNDAGCYQRCSLEGNKYDTGSQGSLASTVNYPASGVESMK
jgi:hypothetical protein